MEKIKVLGAVGAAVGGIVVGLVVLLFSFLRKKEPDASKKGSKTSVSDSKILNEDGSSLSDIKNKEDEPKNDDSNFTAIDMQDPDQKGVQKKAEKPKGSVLIEENLKQNQLGSVDVNKRTEFSRPGSTSFPKKTIKEVRLKDGSERDKVNTFVSTGPEEKPENYSGYHELTGDDLDGEKKLVLTDRKDEDRQLSLLPEIVQDRNYGGMTKTSGTSVKMTEVVSEFNKLSSAVSGAIYCSKGGELEKVVGKITANEIVAANNTEVPENGGICKVGESDCSLVSAGYNIPDITSLLSQGTGCGRVMGFKDIRVYRRLLGKQLEKIECAIKVLRSSVDPKDPEQKRKFDEFVIGITEALRCVKEKGVTALSRNAANEPSLLVEHVNGVVARNGGVRLDEVLFSSKGLVAAFKDIWNRFGCGLHNFYLNVALGDIDDSVREIIKMRFDLSQSVLPQVRHPQGSKEQLLIGLEKQPRVTQPDDSSDEGELTGNGLLKGLFRLKIESLSEDERDRAGIAAVKAGFVGRPVDYTLQRMHGKKLGKGVVKESLGKWEEFFGKVWNSWKEDDRIEIDCGKAQDLIDKLSDIRKKVIGISVLHFDVGEKQDLSEIKQMVEKLGGQVRYICRNFRNVKPREGVSKLWNIFGSAKTLQLRIKDLLEKCTKDIETVEKVLRKQERLFNAREKIAERVLRNQDRSFNAREKVAKRLLLRHKKK